MSRKYDPVHNVLRIVYCIYKKIDTTIFRIYNKIVKIEFDPEKSEANNIERGLPFSVAAEFDFETAWYLVDDRRDYGETRIRALGLIDKRVHALVFTETADGIRVISLRKANQREVRRYEQETA